MRAVDIIIKKRDQFELSKEEIEFFINGFTNGDIPPYQASAWAMAVLLNGMTPRETMELTMAMVNTGETLDLTNIVRIAVDKHSTGGVGDKTSLVVAPAVAACGLPVGKMSGRGLGFTGGTLDKLESIPGFRTDLNTKEYLLQLEETGLVITGQTAELAPADGLLYALRDVTGTVQSMPLIASSVMSKKIAAGAQGIVLDVKVGSGAFMKDLEDAQKLAELMVSIAKLANLKAVAMISDMNQPLGNAVGNALELAEAIKMLHGEGPPDFYEHCLVVAGQMLVLGGLAEDKTAGESIVEKAILDGGAWDRFREMVVAQGGDVQYVDEPHKLPSALRIETISAPANGYLTGIDARAVGEAAARLGAGRNKKGVSIDHAVGVIIHQKVGDYVDIGQPLFTVHANDRDKLEIAKQEFLDAHTWGEEPVDRLKAFYGVIH